MPLDTVEHLHEHLRLAGIVELTTIPTYLYAMYSLDDPTSDAAKLIRSVAVEEMLHLALVGNLLLGTGGEPKFYAPESIPSYPLALPHHVPETIVSLEPCSRGVIRDLFMVIEQPAELGAPAEADEYETLGQFYSAIELAVKELEPFDNPRLDRQLSDSAFYNPVKFDTADSGGLVGIHDCDTAMAAMEIIIHQGEGVGDHHYADPDHRELTHYYKFEQLADGVVEIGLVRPVMSNPHVTDFPPYIRPVATLANALYSFVLYVMDELYAPGADANALISDLYGAMAGLLSPVAHYLTTLDVGGDYVASPTFEFYEFAGAPRAEIVALAQALVGDHPHLEPVIHQIVKRWG